MTFRFLPTLFCLAIIAFLSLMPGDDLPQKGLFGIPHLDKVVHLGMYGLLAILLVRTFRATGLFLFSVILLFCTTYGGMMEILQSTLAVNRTGSWGDLLADGTGAVLGVLAWRARERGGEGARGRGSEGATGRGSEGATGRGSD